METMWVNDELIGTRHPVGTKQTTLEEAAWKWAVRNISKRVVFQLGDLSEDGRTFRVFVSGGGCASDRVYRFEWEAQPPPEITPRCPEIEVQLTGEDGNVFAVMEAVREALRKGGYSVAVVNAYTDEAMAGDYDNLLRVTMRWVEVS